MTLRLAHGRPNTRVFASAALALSLALARTPSASACGGCLQPMTSAGASEQVVTDHRMVLSLSATQTTLWDQFRYAGSPEEFVWILPVRTMTGAQVGVGDNNFVEAVDRVSTPTVSASVTCLLADGTVRGMSTTPPGGRGGSTGGSGGGGCGGGTLTYMEGSGGGTGGAGGTGGSSAPGTTTRNDLRASSDVLVSSMAGESVVGPYAVSVVDPAAGGMGIDQWLAENGLAVPSSVRALVDQYARDRYGFVAVRLRPGVGVQQMQPVRVTLPGYQPVLPLRFVAAGIGDKVGLLLMVLANARVQARDFANPVVPEAELLFDWARSSSNYRALFDGLLRGPGAWVTESSEPLLATAMDYEPTPEDEDAGAAVMGARDEDTGEAPFDAGPVEMRPRPFVDRRIAFAGFPGRYAVLTRLRTSLTGAQLARDLMLEASTAGPRSRTYDAPRSVNTPCAALGGADYTPPRTTAGRSLRVQSEEIPAGQCSIPRVSFGGRALSAWALGAVGLAYAWRRKRRAG